jgi:hypothetical protein
LAGVTDHLAEVDFAVWPADAADAIRPTGSGLVT